MGYAIFMHRSDSIYEDSPSEHYQFPKLYLSRAQACIGDWIVYFEPAGVKGSRGYFAIAKVQAIIPDPKIDDMFIAVIEPGSYLDFANPVPFRDADGPVERGLLTENGTLARTVWAVRPLSPADFDRIKARGLEDGSQVLPRVDDQQAATGFEEVQTPFVYDQPRDRVQQVISRAIRDRVFRKVVLRAYDERCVMTGLRLINGGGRAEVAAAHIKPVEADGPDIVNNGIALSGTAHWMFDRGLISLGDDLRILISRHVNNPDEVRSFLRPEGFATTPVREKDRPHPAFLQWHREHCFKR
jgi:putative restriction endonuclease